MKKTLVEEIEAEMSRRKGLSAWRHVYWAAFLASSVIGLLFDWSIRTVLVLAVLAVAVRP